MARSYAELMGLEAEAERLVRAGETRAEVSRRLGVHPQTLACWALRGGWRKKDIDIERSGEATRRTILAIRSGNAAAEAQRRLRAELSGVIKAAVGLLADGSEAALERLEVMLAGMKGPDALGRLEAPRVELGPDPKTGHLRSLGDGVVAGDPGYVPPDKEDEEENDEEEDEYRWSPRWPGDP